MKLTGLIAERIKVCTMNIDHLEEYIVLAQCGDFNKAARACGISQTTLSRHISALEHELGRELIIRGHGFTELTDFGRSAVQKFERIIYSYQTFTCTIKEGRQGYTDRPRIIKKMWRK